MPNIQPKFWTDYPIAELGDEPHVEAPIREVKLVSFDQNKYVKVVVGDAETEIKTGYIYTKPGRVGEVPSVKYSQLSQLPVTQYA